MFGIGGGAGGLKLRARNIGDGNGNNTGETGTRYGDSRKVHGMEWDWGRYDRTAWALHASGGWVGLLSFLSFFFRPQKGRLDGLNVFPQSRFKACIVGDGGTSHSCIAALYYNIIVEHSMPILSDWLAGSQVFCPLAVVYSYHFPFLLLVHRSAQFLLCAFKSA